ncbi:hypothetical protein FRC07_006193 [Ceratobasidium sp. 392]|nr:hypothetical protein FRC07_006193 [Ceratobasidium sp. 392]
MSLFDIAVAGYSMNRTVYDTDIDHVMYEPKGDFCTRWEKWLLWWKCANWIQPWKFEVYKSQGRGLISVHRSINHGLPSVTVRFEGSSIWLYGPPRANLPTIPPDYKICLFESLYPSSTRECYRVNIAEAYSVAHSYDEPVVIFSKGGLRYQKHQVTVSVANPTDETKSHLGIQFSHAVYTIERPTPWPVEEDHWRFRRVVMHDTHPLLSYNPKPATSCSLWWCSESGWTPKTYRAENGTLVSWHQLESHAERGRGEWGVETTVTAGSVAVYGIPRVHIVNANILSQICVQLNSGPCSPVDVQHAYLNSKDQDEPVLLWHDDTLDSSRKTHISIRLIETDNDQTSVFPFKAIHYLEPQQYASPEPLIDRLQSIEVAHDDRAIIYTPKGHCTAYFLDWCANWVEPWALREEGPFGSQVTFRSTKAELRTTDDPTITFKFLGAAVYVYGAPKLFVKNVPLAPQRICVDDVCHVVDVEQAYLNAPEDMNLEFSKQHTFDIQGSNQRSSNITTSLGLHPEYEPVLIWSITGLDEVPHKLQMALASLPSEDNAEMTVAKEPLLPRVPPNQDALGAPPAAPRAPSYTRLPWYSRPPFNMADDSRTVTSDASTQPPPYNQVLNEARARQERTAEYVTGQRVGSGSSGATEGTRNNQGPRHGDRGGRRERRQRRRAGN